MLCGGFADRWCAYSKPMKILLHGSVVSVSVYAMNLLELTNGQEDPNCFFFQDGQWAGVVIASAVD
jgi:hypothetical protein